MASWCFESTDKNRVQVIWRGAFKPPPYSLTTKKDIGGTDRSKEASFGLPHNYNRIQLTWAAARNPHCTTSPVKRLQDSRTAAHKPHLGSLTIKEATGDMGYMQVSFGLSIKIDYR